MVMDMMRMRIGRRYAITLPNGNDVSGICQKINPGYIVLNSRLSSHAIPREDLANSSIQEI